MTANPPAVPGITYKTITHSGKVRSQNEDWVLMADWDGALLIVVADGMGGQRGGAVAAEIVVESFRELADAPVPESRQDCFELLLSGFYEAANTLKERENTDFALINMAAKAVAALVTEEECIFQYAGDCRLYHFRGGSLRFVTCDHSIVNALRDTGEITAEEADNHPMPSIVTSSISASRNSILDVHPKWIDDTDKQPAYRKLAARDTLLLCSDGLGREVDPSDVVGIVHESNPGYTPECIAWACIGAMLQTGGQDKITLASLKI